MDLRAEQIADLTEDQIQLECANVKGYYVYLFKQYFDLCAAFPPPGVNAANGYVRDSIAGIPGLNTFSAQVHHNIIRIGPVGTDKISIVEPGTFIFSHATRLAENYVNTWRQFYGAFATYPNYFSSFLRGPLEIGGRAVGEVVEEVKRNIGGLGIALTEVAIAAYTADPKIGAKAKADIDSEISIIISNVSNSMVFSGAHMNGNIAPAIQNAAKTGISELDRNVLNVAKGGPVEVFAVALRSLFSQLAKLPIDDEKPWLTAEWQLRFQAIMWAGYQILSQA